MNLIFKKIFLLISIIGFIFALNPISDTSNNNELNNANLRVSTFSGKIFIDNNWTEAKAAGICTGTGTKSDPYVIKDLKMNGGGVGSCILIQNSTAYIKIINCTIYNSGANFFDAAIKILNAKNIELRNNILFNQLNGILIYLCNDTVISGNDCSECTGVKITYCQNIFVYYNNFVSTNEYVASFNADHSNITWNSPQKLTYTYQGRTYTNFIGSYFSGYSGDDNNNDGIGDSPLVIDPHKPTPIIVDRYPLMETIENYEITESAFISGFNLLYFSMIILFTSLGIILKLKRKKI